MSENKSYVDEKFKNTVWLKQTTIEAVRDMYKKDNCRTKSEFIERAIMFYIGFITSDLNPDYLPTIITSTVRSVVKENDNRIEKILFKLAVELAMTMNIVASDHVLSDDFLRDLRHNCIEELKITHGDFKMEDANVWQNRR